VVLAGWMQQALGMPACRALPRPSRDLTTAVLKDDLRSILGETLVCRLGWFLPVALGDLIVTPQQKKVYCYCMDDCVPLPVPDHHTSLWERLPASCTAQLGVRVFVL
jgi:hypothetical protein